MSEVIRLSGIRKRYQQGDNVINALDGVDLTLKRGEFVAIMGASGSGKSTLLYTLGLMARPTSGTYHLDGSDVSTLPDDRLAEIRNSKVGFIFQSFNLLPKTSALDNVLLPTLYTDGNGGDAALERALELLEMVSMSHRLKNHPNQLSGGEQQRVAIARALINEPSIILADEPTGNLDSKTSADVMEIITTLHKQGNTIIMVTHEEDIAAYAQRTIRMKDGRIISGA